MTPWSGRRLHVVGLGGAGMSAYAIVSRALGATVTGSDRAESPYLARVREAGIAPAIGHAAENVAVPRHLALNLLRHETTATFSVRAKHLMAGWDEAYLLKDLAA